MRFPRNTRLLALFMWVVLAALAVSGFAAFQPDEVVPIPEADPTVRAEVTGLAPSAIYDFEPAPIAWVDPVVPEMTATSTAPIAPAPQAPTTEPSTTTTAPRPTATTTPPTTTTAAPATTSTEPTAPDSSTPSDPASHPSAVEAWRPLVEAWFPPEQVDRALTVMWCESRGNPDATNPSSGAAGLFQHIPRFWETRSARAGFAGASIYDPTANVGVAAHLVATDGWMKHWYPSAHCWA